jgi:hypothetical protein
LAAAGTAVQHDGGAEPNSWMVFRRVTEQEFFDRYLLRRCQDDGGDPRCFEGCFSERYGR